jgi:hypothetical protein
MAIVLTLNENLEQIIIEAERLTELEQKEVLAYVRTLNLNKKKRKAISKPVKGLEPLSMEEIDRIKHESRKYYAK